MSADGIFKRFVEPGRLASVRYGPHAGKMVTIVDIVDLKRVVVDGAGSGDAKPVARQVIPTKWLALTSHKCALKRGAKEKSLKKSIAKDGVMAKWAQTGWAKKQAAFQAKKNLTDFERFKLMLAKKKMGHSARAAVRKATKGKKF